MTDKVLKSTLLVSLILVMAIGAPAMTNAQTGSSELDLAGMFSDSSSFSGILGTMAGAFGGFGGAGKVIGQILMILADQFMNLTGTELIDGLFVLNATADYVDNSTVFVPGATQKRTYYADYDIYEQVEPYIEGNLTVTENAGYPYCEVSRTVTGTKNTTVTTSVGMSVTLAIWDSDNTLVNTIDRIVKTVQKVYKIMNDPASDESKQQAAIKEAVSAIMYLLIHINDIITGDELILCNPITYSSTKVEGNFTETHNWKMSVYDSNGGVVKTLNLNQTTINHMAVIAEAEENDFMSWLTWIGIPDGKHTIEYGSFSFDLVELWLKRFYVSLDMGALADLIGGSSESTSSFNPASILKDLDIEFYLIWHHLVGGLFYDDANDNGEIDVTYVNATDANGDVIMNNGTAVQRPDSSEVTHFIGIKSMSGRIWRMPTIGTDGKSVTWGVRFLNPVLFWTPIGMSSEDRCGNSTSSATLNYLDLGFTFTAGEDITIKNMDGTDSDVKGKDASVKLNQAFGNWSAVPSSLDSSLDGLDFSVVYVSTILHVHFTLQLLQKALGKTTTEEAEDVWSEGSGAVANSYSSADNSLSFGTAAATGTAAIPMVARVDIAGPSYDIYEHLGGAKHTQKASTQIIPLALYTLDAQAGVDYTSSAMTGGGFTANAFLGVEFSVMLYSVNYPAFSDYSGGEIVHDPTFSIFMTFEAGTYWAIILLVGVVALVGIAAVLITRSKNNR